MSAKENVSSSVESSNRSHPRSTRRVLCESLEQRLLFAAGGSTGTTTTVATPVYSSLNSAGLFYVTGDSANDVISIQLDSIGQAITSDVNGIISTGVSFASCKAFIVHGGPGNDTISIGPGIPGVLIQSGSGNSTLIGGLGNDTMVGGAGRDLIQGGPGHDSIIAKAAGDTIRGGHGIDTIVSVTGGDSIVCGAGNKLIYADNNGPDTILGGPSHDTVYADASGIDRITDITNIILVSPSPA